jgi:DNA-directed RNA polymerase specialized sigma24 family protein
MVEAVRRYSKQPHLWAMSKRLGKLLDASHGQEAEGEPAPHHTPRVHKLSQRLSEETVQALLKDYRNGSSLSDLQRTYSLGRGSVQRLLRDAEVRRRRKSLSEAEVAVLVKRYEAGRTIREIAAEQALPKTTVQDALAGAGIVSRPATRCSRIKADLIKPDPHQRQVK